jgi:hypothetical protein
MNVPIYQTLVVAYAQAIYKDGTKTFAQIRADYVIPVKQYAADHYFINEIDNALAMTWISQQEYTDTMALKGPEDPQYDPTLMSQPIE